VKEEHREIFRNYCTADKKIPGEILKKQGCVVFLYRRKNTDLILHGRTRENERENSLIFLILSGLFSAA
jgi:hypothetical protein